MVLVHARPEHVVGVLLLEAGREPVEVVDGVQPDGERRHRDPREQLRVLQVDEGGAQHELGQQHPQRVGRLQRGGGQVEEARAPGADLGRLGR